MAIQIYPVFIPHAGCPFRCVFCDQAAITGTSLNTRPPVDQIRYIRLALTQFQRRYHFQSKEIAFYGGTFTAMDESARDFWLDIVKPCMDRRTSIRVSTRPDCVGDEQLKYCRKRGVHTIELGVQSFDDHALKESLRGYDGETAEQGCRRVLASGFHLGIQLMPGLPGDTLASFMRSVEITADIRPDFVRLYPAVVLANTEMERWMREGKYQPWSLEQAVEACDLAVERLHRCGVSIAKVGLHSDLPQGNVCGGPFHRGFGELVRARGMVRRITSEFRHGHSLVISPRDISLLRGHAGRYFDDFRQEQGEIPIYIDRNLPKGVFSVVESSAADSREWSKFRTE
jgi:histone acetyltransferase (RNA polymerase elongator complex component)